MVAPRLLSACPTAYEYFASGGLTETTVARGGQGIPASTGSAAKEIAYFLDRLR